MILRNIFNGMYTFDALQENLGVSTSVLSARLHKLIDASVLEKRQSKTDRRSFEYRLTKRGHDLYPVMVALHDWGEKWRPNKRGRRLVLIEKATGEPIAGAKVLSNDLRSLQSWDIRAEPGPGAGKALKTLLRGQTQTRAAVTRTAADSD